MIDSLRAGACILVLALPIHAQATVATTEAAHVAVTTGSIADGDFVATDGNPDGLVFLMDVFNVTLDVDSEVTITYDADPAGTLAPWFWVFDVEAITPGLAEPILIDSDWIIVQRFSSVIGGVANEVFNAVAGVTYQVALTTTFYFPELGSQGDYVMTAAATDPSATLTMTQVVPLPAAIWLFAPAVAALMVRRRRT